MNAIEITNLQKNFGHKQAVQGLNMTVTWVSRSLQATTSASSEKMVPASPLRKS